MRKVMTRLSLVAAVAVAVIAPLGTSNAQAAIQKSYSSGFFIGLGAEGDGLTTNQVGAAAESGSGVGLVLGYGFSPQLSLYGQLSGAAMTSSAGDAYSLTHIDIGARVHFRTGPNIVVPFMQLGLTGRAVSADDGGSTVTSSGGGVSLGGGLNAHFTPAVALSAAVTWTLGDFDTFHVDKRSLPGYGVNATTARVHLGLIWFPR